MRQSLSFAVMLVGMLLLWWACPDHWVAIGVGIVVLGYTIGEGHE